MVRKIRRAVLYTSKMRNIKFKIHDTETLKNICLKKLEILELQIKQLEKDFAREKNRFIK